MNEYEKIIPGLEKINTRKLLILGSWSIVGVLCFQLIVMAALGAPATILITQIIVGSIIGGLTFNICKGMNWARWVYGVLVIAGTLPCLLSLGSNFSLSILFGLTNVFLLVSQIGLTVLMFTAEKEFFVSKQL